MDSAKRAAFLAAEYRAFSAAAAAGNIAEAWAHLERVHIVAQPAFGAHLRSHWAMLSYAMRLHDWREAAGQAYRLTLAPLGNLTGRLPVGNTGRADVSAFLHMPIPAELQALTPSNSAGQLTD